MKWSDIRSVDVQSIDLYTHSEMKLYILAENQVLEIFESTKGYQKFYQQIEAQLAEFDSLKMLVYMSGEFSDVVNVYKNEMHQ